jgi:hypothetical protein
VKAEPKKAPARDGRGLSCADCGARHEFFEPHRSRSALGQVVATAFELVRLFGKRWSHEKGAWRCWDCTRRRRLVRS